MAKKLNNAKNYNSSYLFYKVPSYNDQMTKAIIEGERLDVKAEKFEQVALEVKHRQTTNVLMDVMKSPNIVILRLNNPLPLAFNVFAAKDIKADGKLKVFIDASATIQERDGFWIPKNIDAFVAQLVSAMTYLIYYADPDRIVNNSKLTLDSTKAFVDLFCYILDYLRVSGFAENRDKIAYLTALYYQCGVLWKDLNESTRSVAMKVSDLDKRHADISEIFLASVTPEKAFIDINAYINFLAKSFKLNDLTTEVFIDKWLYCFGSGYQFATEICPAFLRMITDTYAGTYLTRQKNIEKILGKSIVSVTMDVFEVGKAVKKR